MTDNDIEKYQKQKPFIYSLRSLYKNTSRQVIKSSEYKPYRFFEKRTIRIKSERPYREMDKYIGYQYCWRFASPLLYLDEKILLATNSTYPPMIW